MSEGRQKHGDLLVLGEAFGQVRAERGLSTGELAAATGIARTRIEALEAGRLNPDYELLLTLARALGVMPSALAIRAEAIQAEHRAPG